MVRNPERIPEVLEAVKQHWKEYPDQRLGQLICNIARKEHGNPDPFDLEDNDLMDVLGEDLSVEYFVGPNLWEERRE